jgi:hypothetical protein
MRLQPPRFRWRCSLSSRLRRTGALPLRAAACAAALSSLAKTSHGLDVNPRAQSLLRVAVGRGSNRALVLAQRIEGRVDLTARAAGQFSLRHVISTRTGISFLTAMPKSNGGSM